MMREKLIAGWRAEEAAAHIHGWDFSHIKGRYTEEEDLPWDYAALIRARLTPDTRLLDLDTGGGEFLCALGHPCRLLACTEAYPPNAALCRDTLIPLGIDFREADASGPLPWPDASFDMVINRHGDFCAEEIARVLKPGGLFITQQVGAENDRELVTLLMGECPLPFPDQYLYKVSALFKKAGFDVVQGDECFRPIRFMDVGALVWFARIIEWEFPGFSVDACLPRLMEAQALLERDGAVTGRTHRFMLVAQKRP